MNFSDNITTLGLIGAVVILVLTIFVMGVYLKKIKNSNADGETLGENWDGINEQTNNIPVGWAACFLGVLIWGLWYIFLGYPLNAYSQIGEYNQEVAQFSQKYESKWNGLDEQQRISMGEKIFIVQCSQCHGITAEGINGIAQDLSKWGKEEGIIKALNEGSKGLNYSMGEMIQGQFDHISDNDKLAVASYVLNDISESKQAKNPALAAQGKAIFINECASCHGEDGKGMGGLAPDLSKYGTREFLVEVLNNGKKGNIGVMPSFKYMNFADPQKQALSDFINSLGK